eukprot:87781-Ditylum_brightwellii.AAC.2
MPDIQSGLSHIDKFSGTVNDNTCLLSAHVWECPTYVLDPKLQDGKKLPNCIGAQLLHRLHHIPVSYCDA